MLSVKFIEVERAVDSGLGNNFFVALPKTLPKQPQKEKGLALMRTNPLK